MAQNVTIQGASYPDVPAIEVPKTGGGTATFTDVTDTTATANKVLNDSYFYTANGVKTQGAASNATATVSGTTLTLTDGFPISDSGGEKYGIDYHQYLTVYKDAECTQRISAAAENETLYVKCTKSSGYSNVLYGKHGYALLTSIGAMANNEVKSITMQNDQIYFETMDI